MKIKNWVKRSNKPLWYQHISVLRTGSGIVEVNGGTFSSDGTNRITNYWVIYDERIGDNRWKRNIRKNLNEKEAKTFALYWMRTHPEG